MVNFKLKDTANKEFTGYLVATSEELVPFLTNHRGEKFGFNIEDIEYLYPVERGQKYKTDRNEEITLEGGSKSLRKRMKNRKTKKNKTFHRRINARRLKR
jgi:hypothetical protein